MRSLLLIAAMVIPTCGVGALAADSIAAEPIADATQAADSHWSGSLMIYGLLPWIDGDAGVDGLGPVAVHLTPTEILDHLDATFMATVTVERGRFGLFGDLVYFKISDASATHRLLSVEARLDEAFTAGTLAASYRLYENHSSSITGLAGVRLWSFDTSIAFTDRRFRPVSARDTIQWVDPVFGFTGRRDLTEKLFVTATGLVGGFGAGAEFSWDAFVGVGYEFNDSIFMTLGYRGLGTDYSDNDDLIDLTAHGPLLGIGLKF